MSEEVKVTQAELKPCPFCGNTPERISRETACCNGMVDGREVHNTICMRPECWNQRHTPAERAEAMDDLIAGDADLIDGPADAQEKAGDTALEPVHIRLLKRGTRSKWIGLSDDAGTRAIETAALGEMERAGLVRPTEDELPPGPPTLRPKEITDAGRAAILAVLKGGE